MCRLAGAWLGWTGFGPDHRQRVKVEWFYFKTVIGMWHCLLWSHMGWQGRYTPRPGRSKEICQEPFIRIINKPWEEKSHSQAWDRVMC